MNSLHQPESRGEASADEPVPEADKEQETQPQGRREIGGPPGLEPTRYGDWEKAGRCIDF
ncbi:DUF1674 domain-containing protein [Candidatus Thiosymbion oneisti]|uniref:DUF1674 domain-containing protein n=1 Tax=Candidatus Thiosymbion oneisti TaxID=589554 RepID=UPI000B7E41B7|nr:succinate dehydrogenase assembly factor 4 [Candidatus Thiosymbion oneisti]